MRISNVCCCELLVTSASVVWVLASVWPRPSHRPGNYWISRPAPLIYLPIISLHLRHVRQSVKIFVDKGPDINLLNLLYNSVFGVKAEMVKWRRHVFQSLLRLLSNTAYMSADGVPVSLSPYLRVVSNTAYMSAGGVPVSLSPYHISADLSRAWEFPGGGTHHTTLEICSRSVSWAHPTPNTQHTKQLTQHNSTPNIIATIWTIWSKWSMLISRDFVACYCSSGSNVCRYLNFH